MVSLPAGGDAGSHAFDEGAGLPGVPGTPDAELALAELARQNPAVAALEMEQLKQLLSEQKQETVSALLHASQLRRELVAKPPELPPTQTPRAPELPAVTEVLKLQQLVQEVQTTLEQERKSRQVDSTNASLKIAHLEKSLDQKGRESEAAVRDAVSQTQRPPRNWAPMKSALTVLVIAGVAIGLYFTVKTSLFVAEALEVWDVREPAPKESAPVPSAIVIPPGNLLSKLAVNTNDADFSSALSRLDSDLNSFPKGNAQEILRVVNQTKTPAGTLPCDFEWTNGELAVQFRGDPKGPTIAASVNTCASALERFRTKAREDAKKEQEKDAQNAQ